MADGMEDDDFQTVAAAQVDTASKTIIDEAASSKKVVDDILEDSKFHDLPVQEKKRKKLGAVGWAVMLVFLLLTAGIAVYVLDPLGWSAPGSETQSAEKYTPPPPSSTDENLITDPAELANITLLDVKQYYVNNDKLGGQLFIIEGSVVNNFPTPVDLIRVEATLLDENKNVVVSNQQFCGISISYFQLQVLTEKELTDALSNKLEVLSKNTNVQPGAKVPFIFVFRSVPPTVRAFGVKVIEAQKPRAQ
jgi:hypothetical protein